MLEGDADAAIEFYTEDAVVIVDSKHVFEGRSAVRSEFLDAYLKEPSGTEEAGAGSEIVVDQVVVGEDVVTLIGRYTNPPGVYGNTWERQADGTWRLRASIMTIESPGPGDDGEPR